MVIGDPVSQRPDEVGPAFAAGDGDGPDDTAALLADLVRVTAAINRSLRLGDGRLDPTADAVVRVAAEVTGFDVGLLLVRAGRLEPQATTGRAPHELDVLQDRLHRGPCLEAASTQDVVGVVDTAADDRWGEFGARAAELGVASMLCVPLWIDDRSVGALSLYAARVDAFRPEHRHLATLCGTLAAAALADAERGEQLRLALDRRDLIGQAKGILMATEKITADAAFARLREVSQNRNEKLWSVAGYVRDTGTLPPVAERRSAPTPRVGGPPVRS